MIVEDFFKTVRCCDCPRGAPKKVISGSIFFVCPVTNFLRSSEAECNQARVLLEVDVKALQNWRKRAKL